MLIDFVSFILIDQINNDFRGLGGKGLGRGPYALGIGIAALFFSRASIFYHSSS
jgi:hypothetical protein